MMVSDSSNSKILGISDSGDKIFKIAILDDSFAYGLGVRSDQRYSEVLELYLNNLDIKGFSFEVSNYSLNGGDLLDHYVKYLSAEKFDNYDLYILAILGNDVFLKRDDKYPNKNYLYDEISSLCGGIPIEEPLETDQSSFDQFLKDVSNSRVNNCFFDFILGNMSTRKTIAFSVQELPENYNFGFEQAIIKYFDYLNSNNIKSWVFPSSFLGIEYEDTWISRLETHPSVASHRTYALYLSSMIIKDYIGDILDSNIKDTTLDKINKELKQESLKISNSF